MRRIYRIVCSEWLYKCVFLECCHSVDVSTQAVAHLGVTGNGGKRYGKPQKIGTNPGKNTGLFHRNGRVSGNKKMRCWMFGIL